MDNLSSIKDAITEQVRILFNELKNELKLTTELLTPKDVARFLKCDLKTVYNWKKAGKLIAYAIGSRVYFKKHEVEQSLIRL
jgi:excisionase family DNA binding protein